MSILAFDTFNFLPAVGGIDIICVHSRLRLYQHVRSLDSDSCVGVPGHNPRSAHLP